MGSGAWNRSIWLSIWTGGGILCMLKRTFVFRKMWGISCHDEDLLASWEGICSKELIS